MLDLIDALIELFEPAATRTATIDDTGAEPFDYSSGGGNRLYVFEYAPESLEPMGASPQDLDRFSIQVVYVVDSGLEEAQQKRLRSVTEAIDAKRREYADKIRNHRAAQSWQHLQAAADPDYVRNFEFRGFALRLSGWRILPAAEEGA